MLSLCGEKSEEKSAETFVDHSFKLISKSSFTVSVLSRIGALFALEPNSRTLRGTSLKRSRLPLQMTSGNPPAGAV